MKRTALNRNGTLAMFVALAVMALLPLTTHGEFHFPTTIRSLSGPNGDSDVPRAHVGETVDVHMAVWNLDDFRDSITVDRVSLLIRHGNGEVMVLNLISEAVVLLFGDFADFSTNFIVGADDGDFLPVDCQLHATDNWDGTGFGIPLSFYAAWGMQIQILKPAVEIVQQCEVSPAYPQVTFTGSVTNAGNTPLNKVIVVSDNGTPENPADDSTIYIGALNTNASSSYTGIYTALGSHTRNTVTVRATDALGLTVSNLTTRTIPVTASISLRIARASQEAIRVSWPESAEGFRLESSDNLGPSRTWTPVTHAPLASDSEFSVTLGISGAAQFYRLVK